MSSKDSTVEVLREVRTHLYKLMNEGKSLNEQDHEHAKDAFMLVGDWLEGADTGVEERDNSDTMSGSFVARDLYPDRDELHSRIMEDARERYAPLPVGDFSEVELTYAGMEDGVVHYRIEHPTMGVLGENAV